MRYVFSILIFLLFFSPAMAEDRQVVVTIKPLHSLVAAVMEGSDMSPALLVDGKNSLHDFALKPSKASLLHQTDILFYMGDNFETFLQKFLPQLPQSTTRIAMEHVKNMTLYSVRNGSHNAHVRDLHAWMSPNNARAMVTAIATALAEKYPHHATLFSHNAAILDKKLAALDADLQKRMATIHDKPFATFHDAQQYFDRTYHLHYLGAITLHPEHAPSAQHVQELRARITAMHAACVFSEPEFDAHIITNIIRGTGAKTAVLDPEATLLAPGPNLYFQMMENMAKELENCLND